MLQTQQSRKLSAAARLCTDSSNSSQGAAQQESLDWQKNVGGGHKSAFFYSLGLTDNKNFFSTKNCALPIFPCSGLFVSFTNWKWLSLQNSPITSCCSPSISYGRFFRGRWSGCFSTNDTQIAAEFLVPVLYRTSKFQANWAMGRNSTSP